MWLQIHTFFPQYITMASGSTIHAFLHINAQQIPSLRWFLVWYALPRSCVHGSS